MWIDENRTVVKCEERDISIVSAKCDKCNRYVEQVNNFPPILSYVYCPFCGNKNAETDYRTDCKGCEHYITHSPTQAYCSKHNKHIDGYENYLYLYKICNCSDVKNGG